MSPRSDLGRTALWWLLGGSLALTAWGSERVRRPMARPALCLGSVVLLSGESCTASIRVERSLL